MSLRYSIYKVQSRSFRSPAANFDILAHRFPFVKNFFQILSNFFLCAFLCPPPGRASSDSLTIISLRYSLVKNFFRFFRSFFFVTLFSWPLSQALRYISRWFTNCQALFRVFSKKFREPNRAPETSVYLSITQCRRSGRIRRHFCGIPLQSSRRYPHPGMQRSCDSAGSSA